MDYKVRVLEPNKGTAAKVRVLVDEVKAAGEHEVTFEGQGLSSGVYFYYVETATKKYMGKMIHQE